MIILLDCLFIGSTTQDILLLVEEPPASDQRIAASQIAMSCGGPASTAAVGFHGLGGSTGLITAIGPDFQGQYITNDLQSRNFAFLDINMIDGDSPFSTIQVEKNGKRCITHYGGCMEKMTLDMLAPEKLKAAKMIHLGGLAPDFLVPAAKHCKAHSDALLSVDGGNYSAAVTDELLPYMDIFIPDDKTAMKTYGLSPEDACRYYHEKGARFTCVTEGAKGCVAYDGERFYRQPAYENVHVLDTTGAGDNFHGAMLYAIAQEFDTDKALMFSNIYSGLTCEALGGRKANPALEKVLSILEEELG